MSESDDQREEGIFGGALKLPPGARAAYLAEACGADAALRKRVEGLLAAHEGPGGLFGKTEVSPPVKTQVVPRLPEEAAGDRIGRYKLREKIGEGGFGVVYVAEQEEPVRRRVALKVIKMGMDTRQFVARFEAERQALAMMDHPNIAKVLDAGATEGGRPFFVMELVRGIKITEYCDQNRLTTLERLELFIKVCQAVQHAHQKGIIHRDLKPSNILVTLHDGTPVPKIIDFGIAKATEGRLTDLTVYTELHQFIGTPAYMSPEQAEMSGLDIDTRSDIYSLGVLLYELLTGRTPFDTQSLMQAGLDEIRRIIREEEPPRPSTRLSTMGDADLTAVAKRHGAEGIRLVHLVRGDLDWIVMKALEKDRTRRYETANGLAMDIQRHLGNEPILARPPSGVYRFQKMVGRNKLAFAAITGVVAALAVGLCMAGWALVRERSLRARAEAAEQAARTEADKQEAVNKFLNEMFAAADPDALSAQDRTKDGGGTVVEVLDAAAKQLESGALKDRPEIEAVIRQSLGKTYESRGQYAAADEQLRRALELEKKVDGPESANTARTLNALSHLRFAQDNLPEAEQLQREELAIQRKLHQGKEDPEVARALYDFAQIRMEEFLGTPYQVNETKATESEAAFREALGMQRRLLPAKNRNVAKTLTSLARLLIYRDRQDESVQLLEEALAMEKDVLGPEHPDVAFTEQQLGEALEKQGKLAKAEDICQQAAAIQRKTLGNDHPALATTLFRLGEILGAENKLGDGEAAFREALAIRRKALGENTIHVAWCLKRLGENMTAQRKLPEAEVIYREELPIWAKVRGVDSDGYADAVQALADTLKGENEPTAVEMLYREVLAAQRVALGNEHAAVATTLTSLAEVLRAEGKSSDADAAAEEAQGIVLKYGATDAGKLPDLVDQQADDLKKQGKTTEAEKTYEEAIQGARVKLGETNLVLGELYHRYAEFLDHEFNFARAAEYRIISLPIRRTAQDDGLSWTLRNLGADLVILGRNEEAEGYLREGLALYRKLHQQDDLYGTGWTEGNLGEALEQQNKLPEAEKSFRESLQAYAACNGVGKSIYFDSVNGLAETLRLENKPEEEERFYDETLAQERAALGGTNLLIALTLTQEGDFLNTQNKTNEASGRFREAQGLVANAPIGGGEAALLNDIAWGLVTQVKPSRWDAALAIDLSQRMMAATDRKDPNLLDTLAAAYSQDGQFTNAARIEREAVALLKPDAPDARKAFTTRLRLYELNQPFREDRRLAIETGRLLNAGRFAEAEVLAREYLALSEIVHSNDWPIFNAQSLLGGALMGQKKYAEAEPLLVSGYEGLKQRDRDIPMPMELNVNKALRRVGRLYEETGRPEQAAEWKHKLAELEAEKKQP